jgi:predicted unusual protein kinase regulating ubiquinone biosynthesis (AarF/ABC1/UbiB family)
MDALRRPGNNALGRFPASPGTADQLSYAMTCALPICGAKERSAQQASHDHQHHQARPPMSDPVRRRSRVPTTRLGRMLRLGLTAGELAMGGLAEGARRLTRERSAEQASVLLTAANARRLAQRLAHMRGAAMKLGQLLSLDGDFVLPPEFADALAVLRDSADRMPRAQLNRLMGREYGKGWQDRFSDFDYDPIAAASIGQVHYARTADGRELALKVQYPGVARSISSDVENMVTLLRASRIMPADFKIDALAAEAKRQLTQEADYLQEAGWLQRFGALVEDEPRFRVPRVHEDLTTRRVLAMDYMPGAPLAVLERPETPQQRRDRVGGMLYHLLFRELFEFGVMQTDPNFGNYLLDPGSGDLVLLDFGSAIEYPPAFTALYARICRAILADDHEEIRRAAIAIGYLHEDDPEAHVAEVIDLLLIVCEPLTQPGIYDFAASDLIPRARDAGLDLVFRSGHFKPPPPTTMFLHRKLVGSFLLCARMGARVPVNDLITPFLGAP